MRQVMTWCLILFVRGPLATLFMTFIDPYEVHVLSKPWSKLNHNRSRTIRFNSLKSREFITQNKMVHGSRLIQFSIHESRLSYKISSRGHKKILISLITIHKWGKKSNHDSRGKKSPNHASRKSIGDSLFSDTIGCVSSVTFLFLSRFDVICDL